MGIRHIDIGLCTGCTICVTQCPMDVIRMNEDKKAYIKYLHDCQGCMLCEERCPEDAIYVIPTFERRIPLPWGPIFQRQDAT